MRKFAMAGIGVAALAATLGVAAPAGAAPVPAPHAAQAARAGESFLGASLTAAAEPKPIGKVHTFSAPAVRGAKVWGKWYWTRQGKKSVVYLNAYLKDTAGDGKSAGLCYDLTTPQTKIRDMCFVNTKGKGKTLSYPGLFPDWKRTSLRMSAATGKLKGKVFYISAQGRYVKVR